MRQVSSSVSVPAPIGGLNARDALANMPPTDAVTLDNFFPTPTSVDLRKGYTNWATGLPANVESLLPYQAASSSKLFAASGTAFYDTTSQGAVGAAVVTGLSNARWQSVNMGTVGGQFLYAVNGTDYPRVYNGSQWQVVAAVGAQTISSGTNVTTTATITTSSPHGLVTGNVVVMTGNTPAAYNGTFQVTVTGASTFTYTMASDPGGAITVVGTYTVAPAITGVDPRNLISLNVYKRRLYLIEKNSSRVWYLPVNSIGGAASSLDFSPLFKLGGYLMAMVTFTIDNSSGTNEYAVFISSEGEILMYSGSDPSSATDFVIAGTFRIGKPVGRRCYCKMGSDVILLTADGFFPLSKALLTDRSQLQDAISNKIINLVNNDVQAYDANFGWEAVLYPIGNKLIFNVPVNENKVQRQYVMNTITGAWCRFTNWNANCFAVLGDQLYFGGNLGSAANSAYVAKADTGYSDNGAYIFGEVKTAFNYFGARGQYKRFTMVRPVFFAAGAITPSLIIDVDFNDTYPSAAASFSGTAGTPWNTALWNTFLWGSTASIKKDWQGVSGIGYCGALHMRVVNNQYALQWQSWDVVYEVGGIL